MGLLPQKNKVHVEGHHSLQQETQHVPVLITRLQNRNGQLIVYGCVDTSELHMGVDNDKMK